MVKREIVERFEVVFEPDEEGYHVFVPALKGCHSWGESRDDAREQIREAIELWLATAEEEGIPIPDRELVDLARGNSTYVRASRDRG